MGLRLKIYLYFFIQLFVFGLTAQNANPFDLTPRLSAEEQVKSQTKKQSSSTESTPTLTNPFDLVRDGSITAKSPLAEVPPSKKEANKTPLAPEKETGRFLFFLILFDLVLFSFLVVSFRSIWQKVFRAVANDNMLSQFYAERYNNLIMRSVLALYSLFFVNMALFLFLLDKKFTAVQFFSQPNSNLHTYLTILLWVFVIMILKHLVIRYIGFVFPLKKKTGLYNFTIIIFAVTAALILLPLNIAIAFIGENTAKPLIYFTLIALAGLYALRYLRGFFIANKLISLHKIHFLLYLCTVEIAPPLILYRLFINS